MKPLKLRSKHGPEKTIQDDIIRYLRQRSWHVMNTHGNVYQQGFPDLYAHHPRYGSRWIEVKNAAKYRFTKAQLEHFPLMGDIWILTGANDEQYKKLFKPPNWRLYLRTRL